MHFKSLPLKRSYGMKKIKYIAGATNQSSRRDVSLVVNNHSHEQLRGGTFEGNTVCK
jgi:hypothetical protein